MKEELHVATLFSSVETVEAITFTKQLTNIELTEMHQTATFECELSKPGLRVDWYKKERRLRSDEKYAISFEGRTHTLVVSDVTAEDAEEYRAVYEKLETAAKLSLAGKLYITKKR